MVSLAPRFEVASNPDGMVTMVIHKQMSTPVIIMVQATRMRTIGGDLLAVAAQQAKIVVAEDLLSRAIRLPLGTLSNVAAMEIW